MIVLSTDTTPYTSFRDLAGQPVGATDGAAAYIAVLASVGVVPARLYPTNADAVRGLIAGEVKAVIQGGPAIRYAQAQGQFPEVREVETYSSIRVGYAALAVRDEDTELLGILQAALERLKQQGVVASLTARWGLGNPP